VSRKHCLFIRSGRQCTVKDLESRNGTFVNGTPVTEHQLEQGDEVRIGASVFCYLVDRDRAAKPASGDFKTRQLQVTDSIYLSSAGQSVLPPSARAMHDLRTLLRVSTMLHSFRGLQEAHGTQAAESPAQPSGFPAFGIDSRRARRCLHSWSAGGRLET